MKDKEKTKINNTILFLFIIFFSIVILISLLGCFNKQLIADEALYYEIAKSINKSGKIQDLGADINYNTILYSIIISPFFSIKNVIGRSHCLSLFNSIIISSYIFPLYLIAKKYLKNINLLLFLILSAVSPALFFCFGFMQEILFFPLSMWAIYLFVLYYECPGIRRILLSIILGVIFSLLYFCKEIGIIYIFGFIIIDLSLIVIDKIRNKTTSNSEILKMIGLTTIKILVFCAIYLPIKHFVLPDNAIYAGRWKNLFYIFTSYKRFFYCIYCFLYYIAAVSLSLCFYPLSFSISFFKENFKKFGGLYLFTLLITFLITSFMATIIGPYEDMLYEYNYIPRCLIRYYSFTLLFFWLFMFSFIQDKKEKTQDFKAIKRAKIITLSLLIFFAAIYRGSRAYNTVYVDHASLSLYAWIIEKPLYNAFGGYNINYYFTTLFINLTLILIISIPLIKKQNVNNLKNEIIFLSSIFALISFGAGIYGSRSSYKGDNEETKELLELNDCFREEKGNILFIAKYTPRISLYFDVTNTVYFSSNIDLEKELLSFKKTEINICDIHIFTPLYKAEYKKINDFNYVIFRNDAFFNNIILDETNHLKIINKSFFTVYKNMNTSKICYTFN